MREKRAFGRGRQLEEEESLLNLTPLIDVVFVVLIIFILIAPMLDVDKIHLATGTTSPEKKNITPEPGSITIHVKEDNSIWLQNKKVSVQQLLPLLIQEKKLHPNHAPQLFHDKKAHFGTYQTIKNTVELAGFTELDVILEPGAS